jgi:hypothetical protein
MDRNYHSGATAAGASAQAPDPSGTGSAPDNPRGPAGETGPRIPADTHPADALREASAHFAELKEYATYYVAAKVDGLKVTARNIGLYAALGLVGAIIGTGVLVTAGVMLLLGLAGAIGAIFEPDKPWVGHLAVSLLVIGGVVGGGLFVMKRLTRTSREKTTEKYELRRQQQRVQFGRDVHERAGEAKAGVNHG